MHRRVTPELFLHSDVTLLFFSGFYSTIFCRHPQIIRGLPMLSNHFFFLPVIIPLLLEYPLYNKTECSGIRECNLIMYHFLTAGFRNERPEGRLPLIGLSPGQTDDGSLSLRRFYMDAVKKAGGLPVLLPFLSDASEAVPFADRLDGLLLTGGPDPHPSLFGEETRTGCGFVSPVRDQTELSLLHAFFRVQKPVFGICRGAQMINVCFGGTLWQDLPSDCPESRICHSQPYSPDLPAHRISILPGSLLHRIVGKETLSVNSCHHQAIRAPGSCLTVCARASDKVAEAVEHREHPFLLGVQWHPERLGRDEGEVLFEAFCRACRQNL